MILHTNRLYIKPLSIQQMNLFIQGTEKLENELGLTPSVKTLDAKTEYALRYNYNLAVNDPDHHIWYTFWIIIEKKVNRMVGSICFKNKPDKEGTVEIGYGTHEDSRNKGFMTESVAAITCWALTGNRAHTVIAETDKDNFASQKVLQKCNFEHIADTATGYIWRRLKYNIRPETESDYSEIYQLIKTAFETARVKDGDEQDYAVNLRKSPKYIPGLSLVAEHEGKLIGHIMLTRLEISLTSGINKIKALLIAPLSVKLEYRNKQIGSALIKESLRLAKKAGYTAVFLCGDPEYYKRFGFIESSNFNINNINGIPDLYSLAYELEPGALGKDSGIIDFY